MAQPDLFRIEQTLRTEVLRARINWPEADIHNPEISSSLRLHTKTQNDRANEMEVAAEVIKTISEDPPLWRFFMSLSAQRLREIMNAELKRQQTTKAAE